MQKSILIFTQPVLLSSEDFKRLKNLLTWSARNGRFTEIKIGKQ